MPQGGGPHCADPPRMWRASQRTRASAATACLASDTRVTCLCRQGAARHPAAHSRRPRVPLSRFNAVGWPARRASPQGAWRRYARLRPCGSSCALGRAGWWRRFPGRMRATTRTISSNLTSPRLASRLAPRLASTQQRKGERAHLARRAARHPCNVLCASGRPSAFRQWCALLQGAPWLRAPLCKAPPNANTWALRS